MHKILKMDHSVDFFGTSDEVAVVFYEQGGRDDYSELEEELLEELFESEHADNASNEDWAELPDDVHVPDRGIRLESCRMEVRKLGWNSIAPVGLSWSACLRHMTIAIETLGLTEATLRQFVEELSEETTPAVPAVESNAAEITFTGRITALPGIDETITVRIDDSGRVEQLPSIPLTIVRNRDLVVHLDWYCDGGDAGEQLWRLDFRYGGKPFQAQLFAKISPLQLDEHGSVRHEIPVEDEEYVSFRLFIERDVRDPENSDRRVDYACKAWPLECGVAESLLGASQFAVVWALFQRLNQVLELPCDESMCDEVH